MAEPFFVSKPPAEDAAPSSPSFVIGVRHGGWGSGTQVVCKTFLDDALVDEVATYPTGSKDFPMNFNNPLGAGAAKATFSFQDKDSGAEWAALEYEWSVSA